MHCVCLEWASTFIVKDKEKLDIIIKTLRRWKFSLCRKWIAAYSKPQVRSLWGELWSKRDCKSWNVRTGTGYEASLGGRGSTTCRRLAIYRSPKGQETKASDVDSGRFNGKRMHLTEGGLKVKLEASASENQNHHTQDESNPVCGAHRTSKSLDVWLGQLL